MTAAAIRARPAPRKIQPTQYDRSALDEEMDRLGMPPSIWEGEPSSIGRWHGDPADVAQFLAERLTDKDVPGHLYGDDDFPGKL